MSRLNLKSSAPVEHTETSLVKKLGIRPRTILALLDAPEGFQEQLGELPHGVRVRDHARGRAHLILLFVKDRDELERRFPTAERGLSESGGLWIVWPKREAARAGDLRHTEIRQIGLDAELVDYKIATFDERWSGLLFTRRRRRRHRLGRPPA